MTRVYSLLRRYLPGALIFALLVWGSSFFGKRWGIGIDPTSAIIILMVATAWYGGLGPGLLVAALFEGTIDYLAGPPKDPVRSAILIFNRVLLFGSVVVFASARRAAERRLRKQQDALEETVLRERAARAEAEGANRLKDEFLATVSHELRTPLNAMMGWAAILRRLENDEQMRRKAVQVIERNALTQARIVDDILDMSRLAVGGLSIDRAPMALDALVIEVVDSMRPIAAGQQIALEASVDPTPMVLGDPERLRQVIWNLVSNALKFTPGPGSVVVSLRPVYAFAELQVRDTGIGIPAEFVPHLFQRFRQADGSMTRERGGLGLGLAIVRHIVELHGGTVSAESAGAGQGATFTVRLPLPAEAPPVSGSGGETAVAAGHGSA